jgi:hypothetical protein
MTFASSRNELTPLTFTIKYNLWQIKIKSLLNSFDLKEAIFKVLIKFVEEKKMKDSKALTTIPLHLSNKILRRVYKEKTTENM